MNIKENDIFITLNLFQIKVHERIKENDILITCYLFKIKVHG